MNTLTNLIDDFLLTIEASGDVESEKTVQFNRRRIALFASFIGEWKIDPFTPGAFRQYAVYLKTRKRLDGRPGGLSVYYRRGCLQAVKRFGHWLFTEGHTDRDLGELITLPRPPQNAPLKAITPTDIERMIGCCGLLRDQAMLVVLRDTGCRAEELIGMRWGHVNLAHERILVTGKRQKTRWVFLTPEAVILLTAYRDAVPHKAADPVWWACPGHTDMRPLTYFGFYSLMCRIAHRAHVEGKWNPHAWRHAFCERMNNAGVPTLNLQEFMGHTDPRTTKLYTRPNPDNLKAIYDEFGA